ncbi:hypothetical protein Ccrd_024440, partial [Cynara cardunculus var. scolymus]
FGFSDKPQPGYGFDYTEKEYHEQVDKLLDVLEVKSPFSLVVQDTETCNNEHLTASSPIPGLLQQLRFKFCNNFYNFFLLI